MAAPEGYTRLGLIGYTDKGTYSASSTYNRYNVVLFEGSSYVALKDNLTGVEPANDGTNWRIFAQGFNIQNAVTTDNFQGTLQNYIANNGTTNQAGFAADARQLNPEVEGSLAAQVSELNAKSLKYVLVTIGPIDITQKSGYGEVYYSQTGRTASSLGLSKIYAVSVANWTKINGVIAPYVIPESQMISLMCNGSCTGSTIQLLVIGI